MKSLRPQLETLPGMEPELGPESAFPGQLTSEQLDPIERRYEPLLLSAAAGSGKTSVLVERFVRAVRLDGVPPASILAITFTERAAGELRERVRAQLLELGERQAARDTEAAFVSTFHGFCARLLRSHPLLADLDPDFRILDEGLAGRLRGLAFAAAMRELLAGPDGGGEALDLLAAYGAERVQSMIQRTHLELRGRGERLPRIPDVACSDPPGPLDDEAVRACRFLGELLTLYGSAYEDLKRARAAVDFDDLELLARDLLREHRELRTAWSERFELLMVDEFQDTNPRQLAILNALDRHNLFTVGDELQSIYGFRDADVSLFRQRRSELLQHRGSLMLTRNFRSVPAVVEVVNEVFRERFADYRPLVADRRDDPPGAPPAAGRVSAGEPAVELLVTDTAGWSDHEDLAAALARGLPDTQTWRQAEARLLSRRVAELVDAGGARAGDVAVLLRASGDLEVFERALQLEGLRTLATVGAFWDQQQTGDLICYLRALANPLDEEALYGVLASPLAGCSYDCLAILADTARETRRGAWDTAVAAMSGDEELPRRLSPADREALLRFCGRLQAERASAPRLTISRLLERAIDAAAYREYALALEWGQRRVANIHKLLRLSRRFEASEGRDLRGFLDHVEHLRFSAGSQPEAPIDGVDPDAVRLMTIHAAKGLEFPVVCVADLGRSANTSTPELLVAGERVGLRLARLGAGGTEPTLDYEELCARRRQRETEEEDRIMYVAMTRARERLVLSGAVDFRRWAASSGTPAISWLGPALHPELPLMAQAGEATFELHVGAEEAVRVRCRLSAPATADTLLAPRPSRAGPRAGHGEDAFAGGRAQAPVTRPGSQGASAPAAPASQPQPSIESDGLTTLSYTSLSELERCGYRFYLERVLGLPEDRTAARSDEGGLDARARGSVVHRLMERFDFAHPGPPSREQVTVAAAELGVELGAPERDGIIALISGLADTSLARRVAAAGTIRREHPFAFAPARSDPLITGVIDLLALEAAGACLVVDYKSDRVGEERLSELVEAQYGIQRLLYALAALREGARGVEVVHWFLERPEEPVAVRYAAADRASLERELGENIDFARGRPFGVSPHPHRELCLTCPGRGTLCSWDDEQTLRELPARNAAERARMR